MGSDGAAETRHSTLPRVRIGVASLALVALAALAPSGVGGYRMFTEPVAYRLDIAVNGRDGHPRRVAARSLLPHLGRDARRVVGGADRYGVGETNAALLRDGLEDLAILVCRMHPGARSVRIVAWRRQLDETPIDRRDETVDCP